MIYNKVKQIQIKNQDEINHQFGRAMIGNVVSWFKIGSLSSQQNCNIYLSIT